MAKQRYVNTKFWSDSFISELNPLDRYLFLYFLTNEHTNIAGVYELPLKTISFETGIELDMLKKMLKRLTGKIEYIDGWVCIKNFQKHQSAESTTVKRGIEIEMSKIPDNIKKKIEYGYPMDTSSGDIIYSNVDINSNSNVDINSETSSQDISILIKSFETLNPASKKFYGNKTQREACRYLIDTYGLDRTKIIVEKTLPKTNGLKFFPTITTPLQLQDKWVSLESAIKKYQSENNKLKSNVAF